MGGFIPLFVNHLGSWSCQSCRLWQTTEGIWITKSIPACCSKSMLRFNVKVVDNIQCVALFGNEPQTYFIILNVENNFKWHLFWEGQSYLGFLEFSAGFTILVSDTFLLLKFKEESTRKCKFEKHRLNSMKMETSLIILKIWFIKLF